MGSYIQRVLQQDEKLLYQAQIHWIIYLDGLFFGFLGALLGSFRHTIATAIMGESLSNYLDKPLMYLALAFVAYGALDLIMSFIRQLATELVVTDQRVIAKTGLVATTSYELMMGKVEGATVDQSAVGRVFGYGTLMVKGTGGGISPIDLIADPHEFHKRLMQAVHNAHQPND